MPTTTADTASGFRFGAFELDVKNGELHREGVLVKVPPQPFKVLVLLATHPGELVTREEIQQQVWGDETFVDFELGLNYCVNQIRTALGDHGRPPHYIETVPRRGYRFIAPVEPVRTSPKPTLAVPPSVAVLPFANLSGDKKNQYFSDGLADEIITALTRVHGLRVTARTSSFAFRGRQDDVREIGARLGVRTLLEGSVQRSQGRVRVSAQLVDVRDGFHLWSEHYDREVGDVFAIEDEISRAIACALEVRLAPSHRARHTANLDAYRCWLKARHDLLHGDLDTVPKCRACLEQAISIDPLFPLPYLGLAELLRHAAYFGAIHPQEALADGWAAVRKAFELDDSLGEAYALSGAYRAWKDFDWKGAGADFDRALELAPGSEEVHRLFATYYLVPTGRLPEAEEEMQRAVESDPLSPVAHIELGKVLLWARQFDRAQAQMEVAFDLRPDYFQAIWYRGVALFFQGRIEEALAFWPPAMQRYAIGTRGLCLGLLGRHAEARAALAEAETVERQRCMNHAVIYLGLGETDAALEWLDRAIDERDPHILDIPCKPIWDGVRDNPRFTALLRKMRLASPRQTAIPRTPSLRSEPAQLSTPSREVEAQRRQ